jgi:predicted Zn-dependent protease
MRITKVIIQFLISVSIFFASFYMLSRIDLMQIFHVRAIASETDEKLGELIMKTYEIDDLIMKDDSVTSLMHEIYRNICDDNGVDRSNIRFLVVDKSEPNAFTLPGSIIVVHKGLIAESLSAEEVAGVIAHELAHVHLGHIRKKLIRELGLQILLNTAGGSAGGEAVRELIYISSSRAFDRESESDADLYAVELLANSEIDPAGLAEFLFRMSDEPNEDLMSWISTHPGSDERSEYIMKERDNYDVSYGPLYDGDWQKFVSRSGDPDDLIQ